MRITEKIQSAASGILLLIAAVFSLGFVGQQSYPIICNTNANSNVTNSLQETTGYFDKLVLTVKPGVTNTSIKIVDFDGATLFQSNNINVTGNGFTTTNITLWPVGNPVPGTNVLHGFSTCYTTNTIVTNGPNSIITNSLTTLEVR